MLQRRWSAATVAEIRSPQGIALDATGNLYFADAYNYRVRKVTFPGPAPTPQISLASGNYFGSQSVTISDSITGASILLHHRWNHADNGLQLVQRGRSLFPHPRRCKPSLSPLVTLESAVASSAYTISPIIAQTITFTDNLPADSASARI